jgi:hypothetical protein
MTKSWRKLVLSAMVNSIPILKKDLLPGGFFELFLPWSVSIIVGGLIIGHDYDALWVIFRFVSDCMCFFARSF